MMYVKDRNADSTCPTELAFFVTNSSYSGSHFDGCNSTAAMELCDFDVDFISAGGRAGSIESQRSLCLYRQNLRPSKNIWMAVGINKKRKVNESRWKSSDSLMMTGMQFGFEWEIRKARAPHQPRIFGPR